MTGTDSYDVAVVGGGPGGLSAALYTARLGHDTVVIDRGGGRAAMMADTHNVIGVPETVSGNEFLSTAREQIEDSGADVARGYVTELERDDDGFTLRTASDESYRAERVVLATGFNDVRPDPPLPRTARGLHYCLHCDAAVFEDESVYVMGHGDSAAMVAMIMLNFTDEVDLLLNGDEPTWSGDTERQLRAHPIEVIPEDVVGVTNDEDGWLESMEFSDGSVREYRGGFAMYGAEYNNELADAVGAELNDGAVVVDDHGRTSVDGLYAVGDLTPDHSQIPVAMGHGAKAGISIHYDLREFPKPVEEFEADGDAPAAADD
ncbi:thioredoxin-disulfide reductase [Halobacteriales archaeon QS_1_68_20]|nr:MAG: thioredoxin-disulfide reductase [Halobacteriales archaeon QS_1_68_20]